MENIEESISLYSEEVKDILSIPPKSIYSWGHIVLLLFFIILGLLSYLIKYPDSISAEALVTSNIPPQKVYTTINGEIDVVFVKNNQIVLKNTPLALIKNPATYQDVVYLKSITDSLRFNSKSNKIYFKELPMLVLGEIENKYSVFKNSYFEYIANKQSNSANKLAIFKLKNELHSLKNAIKKWENKYLLESTINGQIFFTEEWNPNEKIEINDLLFSIVPKNNSEYICEIKVPMINYSKLKIGQSVNINLIGYSDYGDLKGKITKIAPIADNEGTYHVVTSLENGLKTSINKKIVLRQEMLGTAVIITEDLRLIERVFYRFKQIFNKQ